jgi:hypothetical protein
MAKQCKIATSGSCAAENKAALKKAMTLAAHSPQTGERKPSLKFDLAKSTKVTSPTSGGPLWISLGI